MSPVTSVPGVITVLRSRTGVLRLIRPKSCRLLGRRITVWRVAVLGPMPGEPAEPDRVNPWACDIRVLASSRSVIDVVTWLYDSSSFCLPLWYRFAMPWWPREASSAPDSEVWFMASANEVCVDEIWLFTCSIRASISSRVAMATFLPG